MDEYENKTAILRILKGIKPVWVLVCPRVKGMKAGFKSWFKNIHWACFSYI